MNPSNEIKEAIEFLEGSQIRSKKQREHRQDNVIDIEEPYFKTALAALKFYEWMIGDGETALSKHFQAKFNEYLKGE